MSAQPVDVLRKLAFWAADTTQPEHETKERVAARAAVAKLVEADKEYDAASKGYNPLFASHTEVDRYQAAVARRSAALARVQGGAA